MTVFGGTEHRTWKTGENGRIEGLDSIQAGVAAGLTPFV